MEQQQTPLKRYRRWKLRNRKPEGSSSVEVPQEKLEGSSFVEPPQEKLEGSSSVEQPQEKLKGSSSIEPPQEKLEGSSSVELPQKYLDSLCRPIPLHWLETDPLEMAKYRQQVEESRGFDVDTFYLPFGGIKPVTPGYTEELLGKVGVHCYNYDEASDPEKNNTPVTIQTLLRQAPTQKNVDLRLITESCSIKGNLKQENDSKWDPTDVGKFYTGVMPSWIEDGALTGSKKLQCYVVEISDLEENDWLNLYMEVAAFAKWGCAMVHQMPFKLKKVVVQTEEEDVESSRKKLKLTSSNAIFFITFEVCGGEEYRGIIRQTRDGRPQHLCREVVCEMAK